VNWLVDDEALEFAVPKTTIEPGADNQLAFHPRHHASRSALGPSIAPGPPSPRPPSNGPLPMYKPKPTRPAIITRYVSTQVVAIGRKQEPPVQPARPYPVLRANAPNLEDMKRADGSMRIRIALTGSLQNPAWSPDGQSIVFTRFRDGYNRGPADVYMLHLPTNQLKPVLVDGATNVSQPGSTWNERLKAFVLSSTRAGHDEIYLVKTDGEQVKLGRVTTRSTHMAYEPSLAPDGRAVVFESHAVNDGDHGQIMIANLEGRKQYEALTEPGEDCRQPNWSPNGQHILYQKHTASGWSIWIYDIETHSHRRLEAGQGDKTDATFSPDGRFVVFSGEPNEKLAGNLFAVPVEGGVPKSITFEKGYHGAPSWSPSGRYVASEYAPFAPDGTRGTELIITPVNRSQIRLALAGE
jgi:TolB protein